MKIVLGCDNNEVTALIFTDMDYEIFEDDLRLDFYPQTLKKFMLTNDVFEDGEWTVLGSVDGKEFGLLASISIDGTRYNPTELTSLLLEQLLNDLPCFDEIDMTLKAVG